MQTRSGRKVAASSRTARRPAASVAGLWATLPDDCLLQVLGLLADDRYARSKRKDA